MDGWVNVIGSVGFPIAACAGLGWFVYKFAAKLIEQSRAREQSLMAVINEQSESLKQIAATLCSICERLETVERALSD